MHNKYLVKNHVEVTTLSTEWGINKEIADKWLSTDQGRVYYCSQTAHKYPLELIWKSIQQVKHHDLVHVHSFFYPSSLALAIYAWMMGKKVVWTIHGELDDACLQFKALKKKVFLWLFRKVISRIAVIHVCSHMEEIYIRKQLPGIKRVINIPVLTEIPEIEDDLATERYFLYVGRFHEKKGLHILMEALNISKLFRQSGFILKMGGDHNNSYGALIKKLIVQKGLSGKVQLLGKVSDEKAGLYSKAYFTIMPSITENFGLVATESLSFGTPVIATTGTPWEVLQTQHCGFWIDCNATTLALHIDKAIEMQAEMYIRYRQNAKKTVSEYFDIDKNISKWIYQYEDILRK